MTDQPIKKNHTLFLLKKIKSQAHSNGHLVMVLIPKEDVYLQFLFYFLQLIQLLILVFQLSFFLQLIFLLPISFLINIFLLQQLYFLHYWEVYPYQRTDLNLNQRTNWSLLHLPFLYLQFKITLIKNLLKKPFSKFTLSKLKNNSFKLPYLVKTYYKSDIFHFRNKNAQGGCKEGLINLE